MPTSAVQSLKLTLVSVLGLSKDALHIHVGLGVFVAACVLFRRSPGAWLPWGLAVAAACAGEVVDMRDDLASLGHWRWLASLHDVVNTVVWPTVFFGLARFTRVFQR
ncbi:MAG: hypothetical protein V4599_13805 [Verrucomicrobiota bacterium]